MESVEAENEAVDRKQMFRNIIEMKEYEADV